MNSDIRPRKRSRFFPGGQSNIAAPLPIASQGSNTGSDVADNNPPNLPRWSSSASTAEQTSSFDSTDSTIATQSSSFLSTISSSEIKTDEDPDQNTSKGEDPGRRNSSWKSNDDDDDNVKESSLDSPSAEPGSARVSSAISALENFTLTADPRRRGITAEEFQTIQNRELAEHTAEQGHNLQLPAGTLSTTYGRRVSRNPNNDAAGCPGGPARPRKGEGGLGDESQVQEHVQPQTQNQHTFQRSLSDGSSSQSQSASDFASEQNPQQAQQYSQNELRLHGKQTGEHVLHQLNTNLCNRGQLSPCCDRFAHMNAINLPDRGITNLPFHATLRPVRRPRPQGLYGYPPHLYTSPNRVPNAAAASKKRKRFGLVLPPPAYVYNRTNDPNFNIFDGILLYPELCFHLATQLTVDDLVSLYAISKDFHTILDTRFTTVILSQSLAKAPQSSRVFPFRCYAHLCRKDPAARIPHPDPLKAATGAIRAVPSFRWLRMIMFREKVVHEIMVIMAEDGVPLPSRCGLALKRLWFIQDIPDNARRIGYVHGVNLVTDLDLYFAMVFFVKLDMRFCDPCSTREPKRCMRRMVLNQGPMRVGSGGGLAFLLRVLKRTELKSTYDVLRMWVRLYYDPRPEELNPESGCSSIFGVPIHRAGKLKYEYWGQITQDQLNRKLQLLLRPDQLVMREAVRRGIHFRKHFLRCLLYGYIDPSTLADYPPRDLCRRIAGLEDEYGPADEIGGLEVPPKELRDPILDLGERKTISRVCIQSRKGERLEKAEVEKRKAAEEQFLERCMQWCENDKEWERDAGPGEIVAGGVSGNIEMAVLSDVRTVG